MTKKMKMIKMIKKGGEQQNSTLLGRQGKTILIVLVISMAVFLMNFVSSSAPYPYMNGTKIGSDLSQIFVYTNSITGGMLGFFMILGFFIIVFLGSMLASFRFTGRIKMELHFAAASFSTLGLTAILSTVPDFISPIYFLFVLGATIGSVIWIFLSNPSEQF